MTRTYQVNDVKEKESVVVRSRIECAGFAVRAKSTSFIYNDDSKTCTIYDGGGTDNIACQNRWCYSSN